MLVDKISSLPDNLIEYILMNIKLAIQTSVLSMKEFVDLRPELEFQSVEFSNTG